MSLLIDELDKKILNQLSSGIFSYEDLAKNLDVTRGTIYRRVNQLEKNQLIEKKIAAIPNFSKLGLSAIFLGVECEYDYAEDMLETLRNLKVVKGLWRTFGEHQIIAELICEKGCEGSAINEFHKALGKGYQKVTHISISFDWLKIDLSPY